VIHLTALPWIDLHWQGACPPKETLVILWQTVPLTTPAQEVMEVRHTLRWETRGLFSHVLMAHVRMRVRDHGKMRVYNPSVVHLILTEGNYVTMTMMIVQYQRQVGMNNTAVMEVEIAKNPAESQLMGLIVNTVKS